MIVITGATGQLGGLVIENLLRTEPASSIVADTTPLGLAADHVQTEAMLKASAIPFVVLRNGWYTENYTISIPTVLAHGALIH